MLFLVSSIDEMLYPGIFFFRHNSHETARSLAMALSHGGAREALILSITVAVPVLLRSFGEWVLARFMDFASR